MRTCSERVAALRQAALENRSYDISSLALIDAETWLGRPEGEDWLLWRARRTAGRLERMPIDVSSGELVVGRPQFGTPTAEERLGIERVQRDVLKDIPPFPGGDAGHFHPDHEKVLTVGFGGITREIHSRRESATSDEQRVFYDACDVAVRSASAYATRVGNACEEMALRDRAEAERWRELARICHKVSVEPPETFLEAVQLMFLTITVLWFGEDHGLASPGHMDRTLRTFYEADLAAGRLTAEDAFEIICCFYIQLNMICRPGAAIAVMIGGRDRHGKDATCELSYLCLEARSATHLVYPTVGLVWHSETPPELMDFACRMLATGVGCPAFFNDEVISRGLREHGVSDADSHDYVNSTCVEIKVTGTSNIWVTAPYYNCPQALLDVLDGVAAGSVPLPVTFEDLNGCVRRNITGKIRAGAQEMDRVWNERAKTGGFPLASCVIKDCLARGQDYDRGGARYNWVENSFVGLANLVDGLLAIKHLVYESGALSLEQLHEVLETDFADAEPLRQHLLKQVPKYGTDNAEADALAVEWADFLSATTEAQTVGLHRYVPGFFCWVMHNALGAQTGATPDGRKAGMPLADGAGAAQGREIKGPTASLLSTTKWRHCRALGGLVHNLRMSKTALCDDRGIAAFRGLIETYLKRGGFEIQVNVVSLDTLRDAQKRPEKHRDLVVRVAGYSDYFTHLTPSMQEEIISRDEHTLMNV